MSLSNGSGGRPAARVYLAFAALAVLAGPVYGVASGAMLVATNAQQFAGMALACLLGGVALTVYAYARRQPMQGVRSWGVLLLLLAPQWCAVPLARLAGSVAWLHDIGAGTAFLLSLAAPLWVGLVAAIDVIDIEAPAAAVVAAIAGMGGVLLVLPAASYSLGWAQAPMLLPQIVLGIATVASWGVARPRLDGGFTAGVAGAYLLLSGVGSGIFALLYERPSWQPLDWHGLVLPLLGMAALLVAMWCLWFWLLQRMTLAAFGMRALAIWVAGAVPTLVAVGLFQWRVDAALLIAVVSIMVALRARVADEQPTALGLGGA